MSQTIMKSYDSLRNGGRVIGKGQDIPETN